MASVLIRRSRTLYASCGGQISETYVVTADKWICESCKHWNYGALEAGCVDCAPRGPSPMSRVPWKIEGDIGNKAVLEYMANNLDGGEEVVATVLGLREKTGVGAMFSEEAGAALGGNYLLVTNWKVVVIKAGVGAWGTGSVGSKAKTFLYDHIASVDVAKRWISGEIEIVSAGMVPRKDREGSLPVRGEGLSSAIRQGVF
jgi:hypothetical protein